MSSNNSGFISGNSGFISGGPLASGFVPGGGGYSETLISSSGSMGSLYCRTYSGTGLREVIKRIKPEHAGNQQFRSLFIQEFTNLRQLSHASIVAAKEQGEDSQGLWYSMEYIDGCTLGQIIEASSIQSIASKTEILRQILEALQYVHRCGMIHRDLKPDNIMVATRNMNVKIIDFGLAISDSFAQSLRLAGSQKYMSPEQKADSSAVDLQSDIYSFGLVMAEFLTGKYSQSAAGIQDPLLRKIAGKCLCPTKLGRYRNCGEILADLEARKSEIPPEVEKLVDEIAADGVATQAELAYLDEITKKHSLNPQMVRAMLNYKLEKSQALLAQAKPKPPQEEKKENIERAFGKPKSRRVKWGAVAVAALALMALLGGAAYLFHVSDNQSNPGPAAGQEKNETEDAWKDFDDPKHWADAADAFRRMSESSNPKEREEGLRGLSLCYALGRGATQSPALALRYIDQALDIDPKSVALLDAKGTAYAQMGDYRKAADYWAICQEKDSGYVSQRTRLTEYFIWVDEGDQFFNSGRLDDAVKSYQKAADLNNPCGMCYLGDCYMEGKGVEANPRMAVEYYQRAAECRLPEAQLKLGLCFLYGKGTARSRASAKYWITLAAEQDNQEAANWLKKI